MKAKVMITILAVAALILAAPLATMGEPPEGKGPKEETAGNNLSFPVIWAEGVTKALPGMPNVDPLLTGEWWYWWGTTGTDPNVTPLSCAPDLDSATPLCIDGINEPGEGWVRAYLQKDPDNIWQAASFTPLEQVKVDRIDWGDNLESVDWYTRSQVRTEVVLFESTVAEVGDSELYLEPPMLEYVMRHTSGWGINEVHGVEATGDPLVATEGIGDTATVYSHCARLTIQKLLVERDDPMLVDLIWKPGEGWTEPEAYEDDLINPHIFNGSVHEGGDGPGYYSAEINVKGRIIYGYTWNVRNLNDLTGTPPTPAGDYRLTFSFDQTCGTANLNTLFAEGITEILVPLETETAAIAAEAEEEPGGGGTAVLDYANNLTYMDIRISERGGGGGGGGNGGGNNAGGNGNGNGHRKP